MLNLDTNIIIEGLNGGLTKREIDLLENESIAISDIVLWEISKLIQLKRVILDMESTAFRRLLAQLTVYPITPEIARKSTALDFRSDPADELIAATSIVEKIPLLTRDKKILRSRIVPLAK
ncbi:type II toxin-antitoxin system VapC family toxin [Leptolyngbya sp. 7M]|uniref:type II toxin-antitoxin system VapC family toxin n=1 Tax=Leptolyngbya sp. 7M TaxID=2812896 RepID=UPI001B8C681A|nr:type II toxin-antitoxin system VapC family toxin [Leptolyngbya sp. 7M]QYO63229.1 type II toxin-antitoxin system VapC family toxin [Leptolyngbya sp. 7M]